MNIRPYQPADEEAVIAVWQQCDLLRPWNDPRKDIRRKLQVRPDLFLVSVVDTQVVGTVMVGYDGHRGWLYTVAVSPRLRRQGVGTALVRHAEAALAALGCIKVNLQVRGGNTGAVAFYQKLGFAVEDRVSMGKRLKDVEER